MSVVNDGGAGCHYSSGSESRMHKVQDTERHNIAAKCKELKTISLRRGVDEMNNL